VLWGPDMRVRSRPREPGEDAGTRLLRVRRPRAMVLYAEGSAVGAG